MSKEIREGGRGFLGAQAERPRGTGGGAAYEGLSASRRGLPFKWGLGLALVCTHRPWASHVLSPSLSFSICKRVGPPMHRVPLDPVGCCQSTKDG